MKRYALPVIAVLLIVIPGIVLTMQNRLHEQALSVLVVYEPAYLVQAPYLLEAYDSVLQEEGVPAEHVDVHDLAMTRIEDLARRSPVMILPDGVLQHLPDNFDRWVDQYLMHGGNVLVVYDVGTKDQKGLYLERSTLADLFGLNTITYSRAGSRAYGHGAIRFSSESNRDYFQIPPGKTDDRLFLSGYQYGRLTYPLAETEPLPALRRRNIFAYGDTGRHAPAPAIVRADRTAGTALYVNLPLGWLKANADDLPLRSTLRTFLFDMVGVPHLMNVENGRGVIIINWHIDSNIEHATISRMRRDGIIRQDVPASFHITAGEYCYEPGDGAGFDACGKGQELVQLMKEYGTIGSHGGWGHNWFANNVKSGTFGESDMRRYIEKNDDCLSSITGYRITEYSAPDGVQPQPLSARLLESMGFTAYYSTSDTGGPPCRSFLNGAMLSEKTIAFPIMPYGRAASFAEMHTLDHRSDQDVETWLTGVLSYVARTRSARLIYSHPNNIDRYPHAVKVFIDRAAFLQRRGDVSVRTMSGYASFFLRFLRTTSAFSRSAGHVIVDLKNPDGLAGICVAMPKTAIRKPSGRMLSVLEDERYYYITMVSNDKEMHLRFDAR
ncbi:MAG TPA: hypothetical protein VK654_08130 [Nitrospirota bacterium]|nr:hypothetical protein [Nitrospirota bacterium]